MSPHRTRKCQHFGIMALAALLVASFAPSPLAIFAEPPADKPATQPNDGDEKAEKKDRPPLGGPRNDRPRRFGPEGRPRDMDDDGPRDRPGNFGPREGRGQRPFRPDGEGPREGRRGMFPPPGQGDGPPPPIPPEVMKELEEIIREEMPELYKRIMRWREFQPDRFDRAMAKFQPSIREYITLRSNEPELAKKVLREIRIEIKIRRLAIEYSKYRNAESTSSDRLKIEGDMDKLVREQVDIRLERRAARIRFLEKRLTEEKEKLDAERAGVEELYKKRLEEIKKGHFEEFDSGPGFKGPRGPGGPPNDREPGDDREPRGDRRRPHREHRDAQSGDDEDDEMSPP